MNLYYVYLERPVFISSFVFTLAFSFYCFYRVFAVLCIFSSISYFSSYNSLIVTSWLPAISVIAIVQYYHYYVFDLWGK